MDLTKVIPDTDADLVKGLKNKEERAFTILLDRYKDSLFFVIRGIVKNDLDAEDLTMVTFTKVFIGINHYSPTSLFRSWLFAIARNTCFDFLDLQNRRIYGDISIDRIYNHIDRSTPSPEQLIIQRESFMILKNKVKKLPQIYREIIILNGKLGLKFGEIEQIYGMNVNTGLQHIRRARILFRQS